MDRFSFALFAAICTAIACLLLLDAAGLMVLDPLPRRALEVASAGLMVGFATWAIGQLSGRP
jgi:ABC-type nickel/cobalt efflux system permease component RcnA